jgi:hypothetical protein
MDSFLNEHIYMGGMIFWVAAYALAYGLFPGRRRSMLISSLFALPQALYGLQLVPLIWNPRYVISFPVGLEDILFCFLVGGLAWALSTLAVSRVDFFCADLRSMIRRLLVCLFFGSVLSGIFYVAGLKGYAVPFLVMSAWGAVLVFSRRTFLPLMAAGAVFFTVLSISAFKVTELIWPNILSLWNLKEFCGLSFWHIPLEELVWAFLYGAVWPMTMAYVLEERRVAEAEEIRPTVGGGLEA